VVNFDTNNIIIFYYPSYAGGKFLINSLGLSTNAVFQNAILAEKQLDGNFTIDDKMQYLISELNNVKDHWNDLNLGCAQLFGVNSSMYVDCADPQLLQTKFNTIIQKLSNSNYKFFLVVHDSSCFMTYQTLWKNARIIIFENTKRFVIGRISTNKHSDREKILNLHEKHIQQYKSSNAIFWDNDLYYSGEATVNQVEQLYKQLELTNFNREYIHKYYNLWISKINEISQK
jgi:hypothetical protein